MKMERLLKNCSAGCYATTLSVALLFLPSLARADIANAQFVSDPQTVPPNTISDQITLQTQSPGGESVTVTQTACIAYTTDSNGGQFSSSAINWSSVSILTMSKNTANKNVYYKDSVSGAHTITARLVLKPETETRSCASWPIAEWPTGWSATQSITIGTASQANDTNVTANTNTSSTTQSSNSQSSMQTSAPVSSYVAPPVPTLFADAGLDRTEIVGADTEFHGRAYARNQTIVENVRYHWNFGDGSTAEGETVLHHYVYPGRYAVTLTVAQDKSSGVDRAIIIAEPAELSFVVYADGSVEILNRARRDLDLSHWIVKSGVQQFFLPDDSIILAGSSMRVAQKTLGFWSNGQTELDYPNGVVALSAGQTTGAAPAPTAVSEESVLATTPALSTSAVSSPPKSRAPAHAPESGSREQDDAAPHIEEPLAATSSQVAAVAEALPMGSPWLWGALGIAGLGAAAGVFARKKKGEEWEIEEATDTV